MVRYFSRELDQHQLLQLEYMIHKGDSRADIVSVIQNEWKKFVQNGERTLAEKISEYNKYVLKPKLIAKVDDKAMYNTLLTLKDKVNTIEEFTLIVLQQKKRVERLLAAENEIYLTTGQRPPNDLAAMSRKELKLLADTLEKLAKIQLETGVLKRAPKFISGEFQRSDEKDPKKIQFQITENFFETLDAIDVEFKEIEADASN
jgi:hypothetical protein